MLNYHCLSPNIIFCSIAQFALFALSDVVILVDICDFLQILSCYIEYKMYTFTALIPMMVVSQCIFYYFYNPFSENQNKLYELFHTFLDGEYCCCIFTSCCSETQI